MIYSLKGLIENKLAIIDIRNKNSKGQDKITRINHELTGIKQALYYMGFDLQLDVNTYHWEDNQPSSYTLTLLDKGE
jgi:hypothetical protein